MADGAGGGNVVNPAQRHVQGADPLVGNYTWRDMVQDINGATGFTEDKAAIGTVNENLFLQIPAAVTIPIDFTPGASIFADNQERRDFIAVNYLALTRAGVRDQVAAFLSLLRYKVADEGFVADDLQNRAIYVDEYARNVGLPNAAVHMPVTKVMVDFVGDYWENIVGVVAHIFRVRQHHYKPEFQNTYDRTWNATTIEIPAGLTMPSWEEISRTGLHCFGVKALEEIARFAQENGRLARGLVIRRDAACAGSAPVRTTAAALRDMEKAKWWADFYAKFSAHIDAILDQAERLRQAGTRAHINARLYRWEDRFLGIDETHISVVAPYVMGWIDSLDQTEPIAQQKAITKRAAGGSSIRAAFTQVLLNEARNDRAYGSVADFFK